MGNFFELGNRYGDTLITYGNRYDICTFTLKEAMHEKPSFELPGIRKSLEGHLEGEPIVKFRVSGTDVTISMKKIHEIANLFPLPTEEAGESNEVKESE